MASSHQYKSWRKGKGKKENKNASVKKQLRNQKRLLAKMKSNTKEEDAPVLDDMNRGILDKIHELEEIAEQKKTQQRERKLATKYHSVKFFERQKLTRMLNKMKKRLEDAIAAADR